MNDEKTKKLYIVLLNNLYLLFFQTKPQKKGSYLAGVKLFETVETTTALEIHEWTKNKHKHPKIVEVEGWL